MRTTITAMLAAVMTLLCTCDKMPANGDLDGMWQLMEINDGTTAKDMKGSRMYCSFQLKMFMLGSEKVGPRAYFGYFEHKEGKMRFHTFTFRSDYSDAASEDRLMTDSDLDTISPWGFYSTDCTFDVRELTSTRLVLVKDNTTITYRKL